VTRSHGVGEAIWLGQARRVIGSHWVGFALLFCVEDRRRGWRWLGFELFVGECDVCSYHQETTLEVSTRCESQTAEMPPKAA
jgi:hypothetical protein